MYQIRYIGHTWWQHLLLPADTNVPKTTQWAIVEKLT
ncbi:unnamed protein product [Larinioides sclopetarius]|uniref:Uncharacterized protein n=1 Tax=Larinioides sclopetarius TaxID=280406 RepID=A0AAV1ZS78_9ARAC